MGGVRWVNAKRDSAWEQLASALTAKARRGAILEGPAGVGKTVMAREMVRSHSDRHPRTATHWVSGTESARHVPLGAFSHLVEVGSGGESAALLRVARQSLVGSAPHGMFLAVDDAHNLDTLSATLVHQLAVTGEGRLLLTTRSGEPAPDAVTALWKDDLLAHVDLRPFTRAETVELCEKALGGPVENVSIKRLFELSQGNPLYLRHLIDGAVSSGALHCVEGVWQLRGRLPFTPQLATLITLHLDAMPEPVKTVMEFLAVEEPLRLSDLAALVGQDAVELAEAAGAVTVRDHGEMLVVHVSHPLYAESVRMSTGVLVARRRRTQLVRQLATRPPANLSDRLRLSALALGTDVPPPPIELIQDSWQAMQLGDLSLGEQLARGALAQHPELISRLPLAHSLSWQGRGRESDDVLNPVDPDGLPEWDMLAWMLVKAANRFWMLREPTEAVEFLTSMRARLTEPVGMHTVDALLATFTMGMGEPRRGFELAAEVAFAPGAQDLAVAWAAATATLSAARVGRFDDVERYAARGLTTEHAGLLRFTIGLGQATAHMIDGRAPEAEALARKYLEFANFQQPGRAIGEVLLAQVLIARGAFDDAVALLRQAAAALASTGYSWGPLALISMAQVFGQQGQAAEAADALARAKASHGLASGFYEPDFALARAWTLAAARDMRGAVAAAGDAVRVAEQSGQLTMALRAAHEGIRLGDVSGLDRLERLSARLPCAIGRLALAHGRALAAKNGKALDLVAAELEEAGVLAVAADAAAQAAMCHGAAGNRSGELAARGVAALLARRCGGPATPALERVLSPLPLTGREREIAVMVSQGMSNKAIAERLFVSVRTVEGHVYKACMKLDVPDRAQLATTVAAAVLHTDGGS